MAKREISTTLKNLKFMQRAIKREEETMVVQEVKAEGNVSSTTQNRKCLVIMEGNPPPAALKGRMSFQGFNPSIDKLNEKARFACNQGVTTSSGDQDEEVTDRENGSSRSKSPSSCIPRAETDSEIDHKRKQPETVMEMQSPKRNGSRELENQSSAKNKKNFYKQQHREKLDWSVLRPSKPQTKRVD